MRLLDKLALENGACDAPLQIMKNITVDIITKSKKWREIKNAEKSLQKICKNLILFSELKNFVQIQKNMLELSISLVSDAQIKKINQQFRNKNKATNVLSFAFFDAKNIQKILKKNSQKIFLGDIILSYETIKKEAIIENKKFDQHLTHLVLHALLHLIGYDHEKTKDAKKMEKLEIEILQKIGIKNPYEKC